MGTTLIHKLEPISRHGKPMLGGRFGPCSLEAQIDVRDDGVYVNVRDYSLQEDYTLVSFAALRIEDGKLVLVSSSNTQLDIGGGEETRCELYDPDVPYPSEMEDTEEEGSPPLDDSTSDIKGHNRPAWRQEEEVP